MKTHLALVLALCVADAAAQGLFVAVGRGGRRLSSRDGVAWENEQRWSNESRDDDNALLDVAHGHGRFIAVGGGNSAGRIISTTDGRSWREHPPRPGRVGTIAFGNGRFVAVQGGELLRSEDGATFLPGDRLPLDGTVHARRSACGDTEAGFRFVVIGDIELHAENRRVSWRGATGDGARWDHVAAETPTARDIAYGAGRFVCVGPLGLIESSHDGQTWQRHDPGSLNFDVLAADFSRVVWTGRRFLVSGGSFTVSSADGVAWRAEPHRIPCALAWADEGDAALGIGLSWDGGIWTSKNLSEWKPVALPEGLALEAVARAAP